MDRYEKAVEPAMPLIGAAGGALLLEALSQRVPMRKDHLAVVGAGVAFLAASQATGSARQLAMGAAAASACYAVIEALRANRPPVIYGPKPIDLPPRQAAPDSVSREELQKALNELSQKRELELVDIRKEADQAIANLRYTYEARIGELQATVHSLLQQLRNASAERFAARNAGYWSEPVEPLSGPPLAEEAPVGVGDEQPAVEESPIVAAEVAPQPEAPVVGVAAEPQEEQAEGTLKLKAVYDQLTDDEVERLREILPRLPPAMLGAAQTRLLSMSTDEAVGYLRGTVLAKQAA